MGRRLCPRRMLLQAKEENSLCPILIPFPQPNGCLGNYSQQFLTNQKRADSARHLSTTLLRGSTLAPGLVHYSTPLLRPELLRGTSFGDGRRGYRLWNSLIKAAEPSKFSAGSHVRSSSGYPFQFTKYDSCPRTILESNILSTSYSSSPSMTSGGGGGCVLPLNLFAWYGSKSLTWKTGWILRPCGSSKRNANLLSPTASMILKGPNRLTSSFSDGRPVLMLARDSHTKSPVLKAGA